MNSQIHRGHVTGYVVAKSHQDDAVGEITLGNRGSQPGRGPVPDEHKFELRYVRFDQTGRFKEVVEALVRDQAAGEADDKGGLDVVFPSHEIAPSGCRINPRV